MRNKNSSGFSLIELSIVLVIIGLIVAAIAGGSHMLHTAKLNTVISELRGYATGFENFRNKYNYWPGDCPCGSSNWGAQNGDGDEIIEILTTPNPDVHEGIQAWAHMAKAGFIVGDYDGSGETDAEGVIDTNIPGSSSIENLAYFFAYTANVYGETGFYITAKNGSTFNGILKPEDVYYIDKKMDDGSSGIASAGTGNINAVRGNDVAATAGKCASAIITANPPVNYELTDYDANCRVIFWIEKG